MVYQLDLCSVFEGDELTEVVGFTFWRKDLDVHSLDCHRVHRFDAVLEMIWVFEG